MGKKWKQWQILFWGGSRITVDSDCSHEIKRHLLLGRKAITNLDRVLKSRDITLPTMVCIVKAMVFPVVIYGCESWTTKKAEHQRTDVFKLWCWRKLDMDTLSDSVEIKPVNSKENQPWIFIGKTDAEAEAPILWIPDGKSQLTGKDWRQKEKGATEDEMVGWHHQFSGHEFEQTPGDSERQGSLACCSSRSHKESDTT